MCDVCDLRRFKMIVLLFTKSASTILNQQNRYDNPGDQLLPLNCASAPKVYTQRPEYHQIPTKTNHHLFNHLQTLQTHKVMPPRSLLCRSEGKEQQKQKVELIY